MTRYKPMLAREAEAPFSSPDWIYEVKWDGIRALAYAGEKFTLRSRNDKELRQQFPELEEIKGLVSDAVLDGEIIVMRDGRPDFQAVLKRIQTSDSQEVDRLSKELPATYLVFDVLELDGEPVTGQPLAERKKLLFKSVKEGKRVVLSEFVEEKGEAYFQAALQQRLEGVVAKRKDSRYHQGRSNSWLKIKRVKTCDCIVFGYTRGTGGRERTFGALLLGLYEGNQPVYVGRVGTGFSDAALEELKLMFDELAIDHPSLEGVSLPVQVTWLRPEMVCEVDYHSVTRDGKLRMARYRGLREKSPRDCSIEQILPIELEEYRLKRDFKKTEEPMGGETLPGGKSYVIQEHHSRRLHWDFRLERDGVLKSWAVPKGPPEKSGIRRFAVQVEDHPLEYGGFEGEIPEGEYGAGTVEIWDRGVYETLKWEAEKIEVLLQGERLSGKYVFVRLKRGKENEWLLLKAGG